MSSLVTPGRSNKPARKRAPQPVPAKRLSLPGWAELALKIIASVAYVFMVWYLALRHAPWFDEAQAWLIARDSSLADLFLRVTHYEGSPALWHLLLMIPAKAGLPYLTLNLIAAAFATAGALLLIWRSPLPLITRLLLPFTFFSLFQYAIIARSYVLIPLLIYLAAILYPSRRTKTVRYLLVLILLANVSLHGSLIAGSILAVDLAQNLLGWRSLDKHGRSRVVLKGSGLFAMATLVVLQALPAADISAAKDYTWDIAQISKIGWDMLNRSFSERWWVTIPILLVSLVWFWRRGVIWYYLVPVILLSALFGIKYYNRWHEGALLYLWIFCLWLSFYDRELVPDKAAAPAQTSGPLRGIKKIAAAVLQPRPLRIWMVLAATTILGIHVYWGMWSWFTGARHPYSGSRAAAQVIRKYATPETEPVGRSLAGLQPSAVFPTQHLHELQSRPGIRLLVVVRKRRHDSADHQAPQSRLRWHPAGAGHVRPEPEMA